MGAEFLHAGRAAVARGVRVARVMHRAPAAAKPPERANAEEQVPHSGAFSMIRARRLASRARRSALQPAQSVGFAFLGWSGSGLSIAFNPQSRQRPCFTSFWRLSLSDFWTARRFSSSVGMGGSVPQKRHACGKIMLAFVWKEAHCGNRGNHDQHADFREQPGHQK